MLLMDVGVAVAALVIIFMAGAASLTGD